MPTLLSKVTSLVTTRSTMSTYDEGSDNTCSTEYVDSNSCSAGTSSTYLKPKQVIEAVATVFAVIVIICLILLYLIHCHLRKSKRSICDFFKPSSQYFIFRRCCGKKRKYVGPLEQDYQPYEMIRPQGHHHAGIGVKEGFQNVPVSEV